MSCAILTRRAARFAACAAVAAAAGTTWAQTDIWVYADGVFDPSGSDRAPFATVRAAACAAEGAVDPTLRVAFGDYHEALTLASPMTLRAEGGVATIGTMGTDRTTLHVQTYNTHLFGAIPPLLQEIIVWFGLLDNPLSWRDSQRASRIGALFTGTDHDVIVLQEAWDNNLWNSILGASGQPFGFLADAKGTGISLPVFGAVPDQLHSGLGMLSRWPITWATQHIYSRESGTFESLSSKSFIGSRIVKDGFGVGIFSTHLQAGSEFDADVLGARSSQMLELREAVLSYQVKFPDNPVIITGDLNVRGSGDPTSEYQQRLLALFSLPGFIDAAREDYCNRARNSVTSSRANDLNLYFDPETSDARLDYILYAPSLDGNVRLILREVDTLDHLGPTALSESGLTTRRLSDHYGVRAEFDIIRR